MNLEEATLIGYQIDNAYKQADYYRTESDNWHYWMDKAKKLEEKMKEEK